MYGLSETVRGKPVVYRLPGSADDTLGMYRLSETVEGKLGVLRLIGSVECKLKIDGK